MLNTCPNCNSKLKFNSFVDDYVCLNCDYPYDEYQEEDFSRNNKYKFDF